MHSLRGTYCKGNLVPSRKHVKCEGRGQCTHLGEHTARGTWSLPESKLHINYLELKAVFLGLKKFQDPCLNQIVLIATDSTTVVAYIIKEEGDEAEPSVCSAMNNPDLVLQETGDCQSQTHSRPAECDSRQTIQARLDHPNRVVPPPSSLPVYLLLMAQASSGLVYNQVEQQTASICITGTRPPSMDSGCTQPALEDPWTHML